MLFIASSAVQCLPLLHSVVLTLSQNLKLGYACGISCWLGSYYNQYDKLEFETLGLNHELESAR